MDRDGRTPGKSSRNCERLGLTPSMRGDKLILRVLMKGKRASAKVAPACGSFSRVWGFSFHLTNSHLSGERTPET
jgi:hypothetical protein